MNPGHGMQAKSFPPTAPQQVPKTHILPTSSTAGSSSLVPNLTSNPSIVSSSSSFPPVNVAQVDKQSPDYGLLGILPLIRQTNKEASALTIGVDLTSLFPNISSPEPLHATFAGPWATAPIKREPEFQIPPCYLVSPPPKILDKMDMFSDETLFYIFYTMPKDHMQVIAARNLLKREWMYHKEMKIWLRRIPGQEPTKNVNSEIGSYTCMDITRWEEVRKDNLLLEYDKLERL